MQNLARAPSHSRSSTKTGLRDIVGRIVKGCSGFVGIEVYGRSLGRMPQLGVGTGIDNKDQCQTDHAYNEALRVKHEFP